MKIVIVKKTGVLGELDWKKNVDLDSIYKKCGFRKNKDFGKRHTWKISDEQYVSLYSKDNGQIDRYSFEGWLYNIQMVSNTSQREFFIY